MAEIPASMEWKVASRGKRPLEEFCFRRMLLEVLMLREEKGLARVLLREEDFSRIRPLNQVNTFQFTNHVTP